MAINTIYLDNGIAKDISKNYNLQDPKNIKLEQVFQDAIFNLLQKKIESAKYQLKFDPYKYRYYYSNVKEISSFLTGRYFSWLVSEILGFKRYTIEHELRRFDGGCYTLLHDTEKEKPGIDFIIDFSKEKHLGIGQIRYSTENEEILTVDFSPNSISFIERRKSVMKYVKHVPSKTKCPIIFVQGTVIKG